MQKIINSIIAVLLLSGAALLSTYSTEAKAQNFTPSIVFDMGGKFDRSFNQSAWSGAERFKKESGINYNEFEVTNETQREQGLRRMAQRGGNPVIGIGFAQGPAMNKVALEYPNRKFAIVDSVVDAKNVRSIIFKENEGSFLVGMIAAMKSKTNTVGFVGGMDIPLIRRFACGYAQGALHVNPKIKVLVNMTGNDASAWNNPGRGAELTRSQIERKADVIYAAAGGTGIGVYQAAADAGKFAIGVDSNQNYLHPGTMLTSMVKRVDVAVYNAFNDVKKGSFKGGVQSLGLAEGGVDWALDEHNAKLITAAIKSTVNQAKNDIINGTVKVYDYYSTNTCPYIN